MCLGLGTIFQGEFNASLLEMPKHRCQKNPEDIRRGTVSRPAVEMAGKPDVWISTGSELQTGQKSHEIPPKAVVSRHVLFQTCGNFRFLSNRKYHHHIHSSIFCWFQKMFCVFHRVICVGFSYFEDVSHWGCWTKTEGRT